MYFCCFDRKRRGFIVSRVASISANWLTWRVGSRCGHAAAAVSAHRYTVIVTVSRIRTEAASALIKVTPDHEAQHGHGESFQSSPHDLIAGRGRGSSPILVTAEYGHQQDRLLQRFGFRQLHLAGIARQELKLRFGKEYARIRASRPNRVSTISSQAITR